MKYEKSKYKWQDVKTVIDSGIDTKSAAHAIASALLAKVMMEYGVDLGEKK